MEMILFLTNVRKINKNDQNSTFQPNYFTLKNSKPLTSVESSFEALTLIFILKK